jgi:CelD/BcsL family acetyltransferase involved in cellulose biosynthesis
LNGLVECDSLPHPMKQALRVVPVTDDQALAASADDWSALLARSESNRVTQSPLWLLAWWQIFGGQEGRRLASALLYDGDRLVGVAPMLRRIVWHRRAIPFRRIELIATGESEEDEIVSDYIGVIADHGYEDDVAHAVAAAITGGALGTCDELVMSALDGELAIGRTLSRALEGCGMTVVRRATVGSPYIRLPATWEAYLAGLSGSGRYLVNRSLRDFDKWAGADVELARVRSMADLEEGKRVLVRLHEQRWQAAGQKGVFASELFSRFHDAVLPALVERNALDLCWLKVRGQPVAVSYSFIWDNKVLFYQGGRTLEVPKGVRPGIVLHARCIRAAIEAGRSEYDFLAGSAQYKLQMATGSRPMMEIRAVRAPWRDLARSTLEQGVKYIRERRAAKAASRPAGRKGSSDENAAGAG